MSTYLGSIDQSPRVEQTKAVLVAVVETGSIHPPVCTVVTLNGDNKHRLHSFFVAMKTK